MSEKAGGTAAAGRGINWVGHPEVSGSLVGASGGTVFVLVNRGGLPGAWPAIALAAWGVAALAYVWTTFVRVRLMPELARPATSAPVVYVLSVLGMVGLIVLGARVLEWVDLPEAQPSLVVTAVGLHFLPFARAFRAPVFRVLGVVLAVIGLLGVTGTVLLGPVAAASAAVLAGLVIFAVMTTLAVLPPVPTPSTALRDAPSSLVT
ncbi:hypothetical protein [Ornithinimicrobium faecis]|nr:MULTISPECIES: hypothetical protein [unclassified Ornithinimicrobium]